MNRAKLLAGVLIAALYGASAHAEGTLNKIAKFKNGESEFHVMTYEAANGQKVGMLGVVIAGQKMAITFSPQEWSTVLDLWKRATAAQSTNWKVVGEFNETQDPKDPSHLTVSAGPGVMFLIAPRAGNAMSCTVVSGDFARFEAAINQAKEVLLKPAAK